MKYFVDNIRNYAHMRGWICGQFFPEGTPNKNSELEVKVEMLQPGDSYPPHYHPIGREVIVVVSGKVQWTLDDEQKILGPGDFVLMENNVHETISKVLEPTTVVSIRTPSVPNNKVEL